MLKIVERELLAETPDAYVDMLVGRAVAAQKEFQTWSEEATDKLLQAVAQRVYLHAEENDLGMRDLWWHIDHR